LYACGAGHFWRAQTQHIGCTVHRGARMLPTHAPGVRSAYRELLRLIAAQPSKDQAAQALAEARATLRARAGVTDPQLAQHHHKELVARVSFLRITTPRQPGTPLGGGKFVWREGELVEGEGEDKGSRCGAPAPPPPLRLPSSSPRMAFDAPHPHPTPARRAAAAHHTHSHSASRPFSRPATARALHTPPAGSWALPCRVAASSVSVAEARRLNAEHYKRFYGKAKAKDMFF